METTVIVTTPEALRSIIQETVAQCLGNVHPVQVPVQSQSDKFLTRAETATFFGIELSTLNNWTKAGIITASKFGNRVYYRESDIQKLFDERRKIV